LKQAALIVICWLVSSTAVFAQDNKTTNHKVPPQGGTSLSAQKGQMLCKAWKLDSISEFGVDKKPRGKQTNDSIRFAADGSLSITHDGAAASGTWSYSAGHITIVTQNPDNKLNFKLVTLTEGKLVVDYQYPAPDLTRQRYTYIPKK
jgi:hypothetical protein